METNQAAERLDNVTGTMQAIATAIEGGKKPSLKSAIRKLTKAAFPEIIDSIPEELEEIDGT